MYINVFCLILPNTYIILSLSLSLFYIFTSTHLYFLLLFFFFYWDCNQTKLASDDVYSETSWWTMTSGGGVRGVPEAWIRMQKGTENK